MHKTRIFLFLTVFSLSQLHKRFRFLFCEKMTPSQNRDIILSFFLFRLIQYYIFYCTYVIIVKKLWFNTQFFLRLGSDEEQKTKIYMLFIMCRLLTTFFGGYSIKSISLFQTGGRQKNWLKFLTNGLWNEQYEICSTR